MILSQMREQAEIAIATADVIMFITDVRSGTAGCGCKSSGHAAKIQKAGGSGGK